MRAAAEIGARARDLGIRKLVTQVERTEREMGQAVTPPAIRALAAAVIANPFAGRFEPDLTPLIDTGAALGEVLARAALDALGCAPEAVQGYGKSAMVGEDGEWEHAAALLHPSMGAPLRAVIGGGRALIPSTKRMGGPGQVLDLPLGHKDAAYVRSHFDGMEVRMSDAPRAGEILVAVGLSLTGRPLARVGGLRHDEITGEDGLR